MLHFWFFYIIGIIYQPDQQLADASSLTFHRLGLPLQCGAFQLRAISRVHFLFISVPVCVMCMCMRVIAGMNVT